MRAGNIGWILAFALVLGLVVGACGGGDSLPTQMPIDDELLDFTILREWETPAGGAGAEILIKTGATKAQALALGSWLLNVADRENPDGSLFVQIFDSEHAWLARGTCEAAYEGWDKVENPPECIEADKLLADHLLVAVTKNPNTGHRSVTWMVPTPTIVGIAKTNSTPVPAASNTDVVDGLVSWWPGDGNAQDAEGSNHGRAQGSLGFATGVVGQAFSFNGTDASVNLGNSSDLRVSQDDFTVTAWVRFNALPGDMSIVDKMSPAGANRDGWRLLKQRDNHFWFCFGRDSDNGCTSSGPTTVMSSTTASTNEWFHLAAVKSTSNISVYVNGTLEETKSLALFTDTHEANLLVGSNALEGAYLNGLVDEIRLYNHALTDAEVRDIATKR